MKNTIKTRPGWVLNDFKQNGGVAYVSC